MRVFVTGGTGFVGSHLIQALIQAGHQPTVLIREGSKQKLSVSTVDIAHGDVLKPETLKEPMSGCEAVIHLVGIIREYPAKGITFNALHYNATKNVVDAAQAAGIKRFVHMSANGVSVDGKTPYHTTKYLAEEYLKASSLDWTILRPSIIFGDPMGKTEMVTELAKIIKMSLVVPIFGDGSYKLQPVHVDDVAHAFSKTLSHPTSIGKTYPLCGPNVLTYKELLQIIGKAIGRSSVKTIPIPLFIIKPIVKLMQRFPFFPLTHDQLTMLVQGNTCPDQKSWNELQMEPKPFNLENLSYLRPEVKTEGKYSISELGKNAHKTSQRPRSRD